MGNGDKRKTVYVPKMEMSHASPARCCHVVARIPTIAAAAGQLMASCYGSITVPLGGTAPGLQYLPVRTKLPDGTSVEIDVFRERCVLCFVVSLPRVYSQYTAAVDLNKYCVHCCETMSTTTSTI